MKPLAYRADIDGLRAIAVAGVIIFHAFPAVLPSGFIGVDVFFVLSGFLISSIIFGGLESGTFSIAHFYQRRVRRIFPALGVVLTAVLAAGWLLLFQDEYAQLARHAASGAGFIANFIFWHESGYFDTAASVKPLLHLWSLGVEEQFYLVFPVLLWLVSRRRAWMLAMVAAAAIASFAWNLHVAAHDPVADFYSPFTRFWELMIGALAAYAMRHVRWLRDGPAGVGAAALSVAGAMVLAAGFVFITSGEHFPGTKALLPTVGTALLILAGPAGFVNHRLLQRRALVWVGLISYPLYLWHLPLLVFARISLGVEASSAMKLALIGASVLLAWLTFRFVEGPLRFGARGTLKAVGLTAALAAVAVAGLRIDAADGLPARAFPAKYSSYTSTMISSARTPECTDKPYAYRLERDWYCRLGPEGTPTLFAYGDSHALNILPALEQYADARGVTILFISTSACPPLLGIQAMRGEVGVEVHNCRAMNTRIRETVLAMGIKTVMLMGRWSAYTGNDIVPNEFGFIAVDEQAPLDRDSSRRSFEHGLAETIRQYHADGVRVLLVEDDAQQRVRPRDALRRAGRDDAAINALAVTRADHVASQQWVNGRLQNAGADGWFGVTDALCDEVCDLVRDGRFLYFDDDHLSASGSALLLPSLTAFLDTHR